MNRRRIAIFSVAPIALAIGVAGCGHPGDETIVVATVWPELECARIDREFARWSTRPEEATDRPTRIAWVRLARGDDPARRGGRFRDVDVILGGPIASYRRLESAGGLLASETAPAYRVVRSTPIGIVSDVESLKRSAIEPPSNYADLGLDRFSGRLAIGDPRNEASLLVLAGRSPGAGYSELARIASNASKIEPIGRSPAAEVERGRASLAISAGEPIRSGSKLVFSSLDERILLREGAGALRDARDPDRATAFLRFLSEKEPQAVEDDPKGLELLAELLGATLVDAHEELRAARSASIPSKKGGDSTTDLAPIEPPPWPPAIVGRLKKSSNSGSLIETLAEQIAPNPLDRGWLVESWDRPPRPIDAAFLEELASVGGGRLADDAGFRAWLRSEWTDWARRSYRAASGSAEGRRG